MCLAVDFHIVVNEKVGENIPTGIFEVPRAAIEDAKQRIASIIAQDYDTVLSSIKCKVYRSEVTELNDAHTA